MSQIPLEEALANKFETSTREELLSYAAELGLDTINPTGPVPGIKNAIFAALGVNFREEGPQAEESRRMAAKSPLVPPYNLSPSGRWGGRRRKVKLPAPEGSKLAKAERFGWNGKATYWLPFNEVVSVPYPIYMQLVDNKKRRVVQVQTTNPDGSKETTTGWEFDDISFSDYGDDPTTKDLACSLADWYVERGREFYAKLGLRPLQQIATRLDVKFKDEEKRNLPEDDVRENILIFLYGLGSADVAEQAERELEDA